MPFATIGSAILGFLKRIPDWVIWALAFVIFLKFVDMNAERRGRDKQKQANEREALKEQARVDQTRREISQENSNARDAVDAAVDALPKYSVRERLRRDDPDTAAVVLGPDQGHGS